MGVGPILRVQDSVGRGPYRPGFSYRWSDPNGPNCPPWWEELGEDMASAHRRFSGDLHYGCGFKDYAQFEAWFSPREQRALDRLGYRLVAIIPDAIIAETPRQVVFGSIRPLAYVSHFFKLGSRAAHDVGRVLAA